MADPLAVPPRDAGEPCGECGSLDPEGWRDAARAARQRVREEVDWRLKHQLEDNERRAGVNKLNNWLKQNGLWMGIPEAIRKGATRAESAL